jgi:hypothetical protein
LYPISYQYINHLQYSTWYQRTRLRLGFHQATTHPYSRQPAAPHAVAAPGGSSLPPGAAPFPTASHPSALAGLILCSPPPAAAAGASASSSPRPAPPPALTSAFVRPRLGYWPQPNRRSPLRRAAALGLCPSPRRLPSSPPALLPRPPPRRIRHR